MGIYYSFLVLLLVIASVSAAPPHQTPFRSNNKEQNSPNNESPYHVPSLFSLQHLRGIMDFARRPVRSAPGQVPVVIPTPSPNSGFHQGQYPPFGA